MGKFTQLTDNLNYPPDVKGGLSTTHSSIVTYVINNYQNRAPFRKQVVDVLNTISCYFINKDTLPSDWSPNDPFENIEVIDPSTCESILKKHKLFLRTRDLTWDMEEVVISNPFSDVVNVADGPKPEEVQPKVVTSTVSKVEDDKHRTPKEHLYIRPPVIPQFDVSKPWLHQVVNSVPYTIYPSLPEIPVIQNQVSITTDIDRMTVSDFMKLYPNCYIKTRPAVMYEHHNSLTYDADVGVILPIVGFSPKQVRDNVVKYPHWFKLMRLVDGKLVSFYQHIEINGELLDTLDIWDSLPDSKKIPKSADFIKEYVVRRYLLERDLKGINHNYPIFGELDPFMILFTSASEYKRMGYPDVADYGRQCVLARVNYKRSRNPILRQVSSI